MPLTPKQERFCEEYLIDLNATQAAIRSGYSESSARQMASDLLSKHDIYTRIAELKEQRSKETLVDARFVVLGLKEVAERCLQKRPVMEWSHIDKEMVQVQDDEGNNMWTFDSQGANKAFELLGKHVGIFEKDNNQKGVPNSFVIHIDGNDTVKDNEPD